MAATRDYGALADAIDRMHDELQAEVHIIHKSVERLVSKVAAEREQLLGLQREVMVRRDLLDARCREMGIAVPDEAAASVPPAFRGGSPSGRSPQRAPTGPGGSPQRGPRRSPTEALSSPSDSPVPTPVQRPATATPGGRSVAERQPARPQTALVRRPPGARLEAAWQAQRARAAADDPSGARLEQNGNVWTLICRLLRDKEGCHELLIEDSDTRHVLHKHAMESLFTPLAETVCDGGPSARPTLVVSTVAAPAREDFPAAGTAGSPLSHSDVAMRRRGVIYQIATCGGTREWSNPRRTKIQVSVSSARGGCDAADIVRKELGYFSTLNKRDQWVTVDLGYPALIPTHYSFGSAHPMYGGYFPRNWRFEGSRDAIHWHLLSLHEDDESVSTHTPYGIWAVHAPPEVFRLPMRYFRIASTGPNSFGGGELQVSALELYGRFVHVSLAGPRSQPPGAPILRGRAFQAQLPAMPPVPPPPVQKKRKGKGGKRK